MPNQVQCLDGRTVQAIVSPGGSFHLSDAEWEIAFEHSRRCERCRKHLQAAQEAMPRVNMLQEDLAS